MSVSVGALVEGETSREDDFPPSSFLEKLRNDPNCVEHEYGKEFPLLMDSDISRAIGFRGMQFPGNIVKYKYFWDKANKRVVGVVHFSLATEGPPGCVHGGCIATTLDMVLARSVMINCGFGYVTLKLDIRYHNVIPLGSTVKFVSFIEKIEGKKAFIQGEKPKPKPTQDPNAPPPKPPKTYGDDLVYAEGSAIFYPKGQGTQGYEDMKKLIGAGSGMTKERLLRILKKNSPKNKNKNKTEDKQQEEQPPRPKL